MTHHHIQVLANGRVLCWCGANRFLETVELATAAAELHSVEKHQKKAAAIDIEQPDGSTKHTGWCGDRECRIHSSILKRTAKSVDADDPRCPQCGIHASDHGDIEVTCRENTRTPQADSV